MKKILIIYAPYGSGHKSIAEYIANYLEEQKEPYEIKVLDVAKYANLLGKLSVKGFDFVIKYRTNHLFSFIYDIVDNKIGSMNQFLAVKKAFDNPNIREEIIGFNPDLTISTHFFGGNLVSYYNKLGLTNSKLMTVITDYVSHSYWRKDHQNQDAFIVANEMVKNQMIKKGIDGKKIYAIGLPFKRQNVKEIILKEQLFFKYDLNPNQKTFLFFGGGAAGNNANYDYLKSLIKNEFPINIIFISGKNQKLENKCRSYVVKNNIKNVKILGFTKDVYSLLNASDVVITKPGGATITECIEMRVPMILIPGNGGPEKYNARFVRKKHFGLNAKNIITLNRCVNKVLKNENILSRFKENLEKEEKNDALRKIKELSFKLLKSK